MKKSTRTKAFAAMASIVTMLSFNANADTWPDRPITLVIPFLAGGVTDTVGRLMAHEMSETLGQPVVVENRPGSGGRVGTRYVAQTDPDGYTLLFNGSGSFTVTPNLIKLDYDPINDFQPISLVFINQLVLSTNSKKGFQTVKDLVEYGKANPGALNFGSPGIGTSTHVAGELFRQMAGIEWTHIPYAGDAAAAADVASGEIDVSFSAPSAIEGFVTSGHVKPLAAITSDRIARWPDMPTVSESGVPGFSADSWLGVFAPAGTPRDVVDKLNQAVTAALADPEFKERASVSGKVVGSTPEEMADLIVKDTALWKRVVEEAKIVME